MFLLIARLWLVERRSEWGESVPAAQRVLWAVVADETSRTFLCRWPDVKRRNGIRESVPQNPVRCGLSEGYVSTFGQTAICGRTVLVRKGAIRNELRSLPVRRPLLLCRIVLGNTERERTSACAVLRHGRVFFVPAGKTTGARGRVRWACSAGMAPDATRGMNVRRVVIVFLFSEDTATDFFVSLLRAASGKGAVR